MGRTKAMCGELATARAPAPGPRRPPVPVGPWSPSAPGPRRLCLGTDSKAGRGVEALYGGDRGSTWRAPTVGRGLGQLWTGPLEGGHPVVRGAYPSLSGWS